MAKVLQMPGTALLPFPEFSEDKVDSASHSFSAALSDTAAREQALDIRRSWIVEAPAGSGKTGLLMQRLLKLLAEADIVRPSEVLAITFTRKAAAELKDRVLNQLTAAAAGDALRQNASEFERTTRGFALAVLQRDRVAGWGLLENTRGLNIRTIDAFCAELASSLPLSARLSGQQSPTDDPVPLYREAAERVLRRLGGSNPQLHEALTCLLLHRDGQVTDCIDLLASMLGEREQWAEFLPLHQMHWDDTLLDEVIRSRLEGTLKRIVSQALERVRDAIGPALLSDAWRFLQDLPNQVKGDQAHVPEHGEEDLRDWEVLSTLFLTQKATWRTKFDKSVVGFTPDRAQRDTYTDLLARLQAAEQREPDLANQLHAVRNLPPVRYPEDQWRVVKSLFHVLRYALAELRTLFSERGQCDFSEIALTARNLLASDCGQTPCLQLAHILVDEMQDTSAGQYELIEQLTRYWDGYTQTVFLVGDPKQSIYLFRQARVERFLRTQQSGRIGEVPLSPLRLLANFRSQAALVETFNEAFERILPSPEQDGSALPPGEVPFVSATPTRPRGPQPALVWHATFLPHQSRSKEPDALDESAAAEELADSAASQAQELRKVIEGFQQEWVERPGVTSPPKIAVLARTRAHLQPIITEFQRNYGNGPLPFRAIKVERLGDRPEVLDLLALTRALLHPADRVAWLAILRSPVCGLNAADLLLLTGEGDAAMPHATVPFLIEARRHLLSDEGKLLLDRAWRSLGTALRTPGHASLSTQVTRLWRSLGADSFLSPQARENAESFQTLLRQLEAQLGIIDLPSLQRRLGELYANASCDAAAVELMTIHNAKGLEWDLVLIPALDAAARRDAPQLLQWLELEDSDGAGAEVMLAPIQSKGDDASRLSKWLNAAKFKRQAAEAKRLFYVACTRAREELHLFLECGTTAEGLALPDGTSLLRAAWPAAEEQLRQEWQSRLASAASSMSGEPKPGSAAIPQLVTLAAAGAPEPETRQRIARLPLTFDPEALLTTAAPAWRTTIPPEELEKASTPQPHDSFVARAFGKVIRQFVELSSEHLAAGNSPAMLASAVASWRQRIHTLLRAEGLSPETVAGEADRVRVVLTRMIADPVGQWLLGPHEGSRNGPTLQAPHQGWNAQKSAADRIFLASAEPLSSGLETHLWVMTINTADPGGRDLSTFLAEQQSLYEAQLKGYARAGSALLSNQYPVILAMYFPRIPQMLHWLYHPSPASQ